jgi:anti-sigma factor RsiW
MVGMSEHWTDRLSEYLDGELGPADAAALEQHLVSCDECRATLAELRSIVAAAAALPVAEPPRDLWAGIASGIGTRQSQAEGRADDQAPRRARREPEGHGQAARGAAGEPESIDLQQYARRRVAPRRFSFSMPQLAAAAVLLMTVSAAAAWWLAAGDGAPEQVAGVIVHAAEQPANGARLVAAVPERSPLDGDIAALEATLADARDHLDPATIEVIERSLDAIDQAIDDARAALAADPGNVQLERQLDQTMQKKLDVLRRAHRVQRAAT